MLLEKSLLLWLKLGIAWQVAERGHAQQIIEHDVAVHPEELNRELLLEILRQSQRLLNDLLSLASRLLAR